MLQGAQEARRDGQAGVLHGWRPDGDITDVKDNSSNQMDLPAGGWGREPKRPGEAARPCTAGGLTETSHTWRAPIYSARRPRGCSTRMSRAGGCSAVEARVACTAATAAALIMKATCRAQAVLHWYLEL